METLPNGLFYSEDAQEHAKKKMKSFLRAVRLSVAQELMGEPLPNLYEEIMLFFLVEKVKATRRPFTDADWGNLRKELASRITKLPLRYKKKVQE